MAAGEDRNEQFFEDIDLTDDDFGELTEHRFATRVQFAHGVREIVGGVLGGC